MFDLSTKILVVDDMATVRRIIAKMCTDIGFKEVIEAADGESAWTAINTSVPPIGLVLSDWNMPKLSGPDLVKRIRSDVRYRNTPVILITTEAESKKIVEAAASGIDDYIVKPFPLDTLVTKIKKTYEKRFK